jgi:hypothetical protein
VGSARPPADLATRIADRSADPAFAPKRLVASDAPVAFASAETMAETTGKPAFARPYQNTKKSA